MANTSKNAVIIIAAFVAVNVVLFFSTSIWVPLTPTHLIPKWLYNDTSISHSTKTHTQYSIPKLSAPSKTFIIPPFVRKIDKVNKTRSHKAERNNSIVPIKIDDGVEKSSSPKSDSFQFLSNLCAGRTITLVICVPIARSNFEGRKAIRETWGSANFIGNTSVVAFFVGSGKETEDINIQRSITLESEQFGDIIQGKFIDTYENLTLKSLSLIHWASQHCHHSLYLLKADDDMYINVPLLITTLDQLSKSYSGRPFVVGSVQVGAVPQRDKKNKWYTPRSAFKENVFPRYCSGTAYAMTMSAAVAIHRISESVPFFWLEDVYITGLCTRKAKIQVINDNRFTYNKPQVSGRTFQHQISGHRYSIEEIRKIHKELTFLMKS